MTRDEALQDALWQYLATNNCNMTAEELREQFFASLAANGYAIVPAEATDEAIKAGREAIVEQSGKTYFPSNANMARVYSAMIATAQKEKDK